MWTNTCGRCAYRGPWMMETVAREQMIDLAARAIGIDPLELRRRNVITRDELPYTTATGHGPRRHHARRDARAGGRADRLRRVPARAGRRPREGRLLGVGLGLYVEPSAWRSARSAPSGAPSGSSPTGSVDVLSAPASHGQSIETTMAQVVADHLGVDLDDVVVIQGDTAVDALRGGHRRQPQRGRSPAAPASRPAERCGTRSLRIAAHLLEAAPRTSRWPTAAVQRPGRPRRRAMPLARGRRALAYLDPGRAAARTSSPASRSPCRYQAPPIMLVQRLPRLHRRGRPCTPGRSSILRYVVSEDCGVMINPKVVEGQIAGGVVQGIGGVLYEHIVYDDDGNPLTTTFLDYLLPTAAEVPDIEYGHVETPAPTPGGYKGDGRGRRHRLAAGRVQRGRRRAGAARRPVTGTPLGPAQVLDALTRRGSS